MVIPDGHLGRAGSALAEDDPPLVIDADGVKTLQLSFEEFEPVARGNGEVIETARLIHLDSYF